MKSTKYKVLMQYDNSENSDVIWYNDEVLIPNRGDRIRYGGIVFRVDSKEMEYDNENKEVLVYLYCTKLDK